MLNICLCDDDKNILSYYSKKIHDLSESNNYIVKIETFMSGENLIFELEDNPNRFNIIIIDIMMKNINGIDTAKILREYGYNGIIIFLTISKEFAFDSFKVEPMSYILKTDRSDIFDNIFLKAIERANESSNRSIIIYYKNTNKFINLDDIIYMESFKKKIVLHNKLGTEEELIYVFKDIYEKVKDYGFVRCHKSYIVNINYIKSFNNLECNLQKDLVVPIGRKYSKYFRDRILENEFNKVL